MDHPYCKTCPFWDCFKEVEDAEGLIGPLYIPVHERKDDDDLIAEEFRCKQGPPPSVGEQPLTYLYDWCGQHPDFQAWIASLSQG